MKNLHSDKDSYIEALEKQNEELKELLTKLHELEDETKRLKFYEDRFKELVKASVIKQEFFIITQTAYIDESEYPLLFEALRKEIRK